MLIGDSLAAAGLDVAVPDDDINQGILLPLPGAILALLGREGRCPTSCGRGRRRLGAPGRWVGDPRTAKGTSARASERRD